MLKRGSTLLALGLLMAAVAFTAPSAWAITCTSGNSTTTCGADLTIENAALSAFNVDIHLLITTANAGTATLTFTSTFDGTNTYLMGGQGAIGISTSGLINAASISLSPLATAGPALAVQSQPPGSLDGFGSFIQTFDLFDGFTHAANMISFNVTGLTAGLNAADVIFTNAAGFWAASHVFVAVGDCHTGAVPGSCTNTAGPLGTGLTGFVAGAGVPEPGTLALLGTGLIGVGILSRRIRARKA